MFKIYTLSDPLTGLIRYVGSTRNRLSKRLALHCNNADINIERNPAKYRWIVELRKAGYRPSIEIIDCVDDPQKAIDLEVYWTHQMRQWGFQLLNISVGKSTSKETKIKQSRIKVGKPVSDKTLKAASEKRKRSVVQLTKHGGYIGRWEFIVDAANSLKIDRGDISKSCKNHNKTAGGFKWRYESEYLNSLNSK